MRIVMLTDDAAAIHRRVLLEAEALAGEGHEVIVVARREGDAPEAARLGLVKVLRIDTELSFFQGAYADLDADKAPTDDGLGTVQKSAFLREQLAWAGIQRATTEMDWEARRGPKQFPGDRNPIGIVRLLLASYRKRKAFALWSSALQAKRGEPEMDPTAFADLPEMDPWERAVFFRALYLDADVVHVHGFSQLLAGVYAKRFLKVPLVYDAHAIYPQLATLSLKDSRALHEKEARLLKYCDVKIGANPLYARMMEYCYDSGPFDIVMDAAKSIPLGHAQEASLRLRQHLGLGPDARILLCRREIDGAGGVPVTLLKAMQAVQNDVHLVLTGEGAPEEVRRIAAEVGIHDRIHVLPALRPEEAVSWSSGADAGIVLRQSDDFNQKVSSPGDLFDFIAARVPIIADDLPFLRQVVAGEGFGLACPMPTAKAIAQVVNLAFDPESKLLQKARAALQANAPQWTWDGQAKKLKDIYARLPQPARYQGLEAPPRATVSLDSLLS